ncbi:hypothetical protein ORI20_21035 [Mycobacterium sp. CVI_P3]|uniref:Uncharacterized protein n=1 Tax=Mycobacterium pinniadriaticum TaxID=2994102 RepID=A0ABT3SJ54_9MYCO|nr:hypothetical protein [Mycobacterium pinniadriaticum]MCX2932762.1 hypothetical protein [Mycobacterium pinniadriaticum]MCX2939178.1 hypothetical protein [Mycobacterium pinniadriaticum]
MDALSIRGDRVAGLLTPGVDRDSGETSLARRLARAGFFAGVGSWALAIGMSPIFEAVP